MNGTVHSASFSCEVRTEQLFGVCGQLKAIYLQLFCMPQYGLQSGSDMVAYVGDIAGRVIAVDFSKGQLDGPEVGKSAQLAGEGRHRGQTKLVNQERHGESASSDGFVSEILYEFLEVFCSFSSGKV